MYAPLSAATDEERELKLLAWREYIKGNYRFMTEEERAETIARLERLAKVKRGLDVTIQSTGAQPGVLFGYAFNISKCKGYRRCVEACINENNLDRQRGDPVHPDLRDGGRRRRSGPRPTRPSSTRCPRRATSIWAPSASSAPTRRA